MKVRLERRFRFSASHLYRRPDWSEEENRARFGKCANLPGHGHNYRLFVTVEGEVDPRTGFIIDLGTLDSLVTAKVIDRLDHQHLNSALPEFGEGEDPFERKPHPLDPGQLQVCPWSSSAWRRTRISPRNGSPASRRLGEVNIMCLTR